MQPGKNYNSGSLEFWKCYSASQEALQSYLNASHGSHFMVVSQTGRSKKAQQKVNLPAQGKKGHKPQPEEIWQHEVAL